VVVDLSGEALLVRLSRRGLRSIPGGPSGDGALRIATPSTDPLSADDEWQWVDPLTHEEGESRPGDLQAWAEVRIVVGDVEPSVGAGPISEWATNAVAVLTTGKSSGAKLEATSELLRSAGVHLHSAVLVGADPTDDTSGLIIPGRASAGGIDSTAPRADFLASPPLES
jgi:hypothetical protein